MNYIFDVNDLKVLKKLENSKKFIEYPNMFLSNTCKVKVNQDNFLLSDEFTICSSKRILPRQIYIYGKKNFKDMKPNCIYLNYWMEIFLKTIELGNLYYSKFNKSDSKLELTIGLDREFRQNAFNYNNWSKQEIINFLTCLFDTPISEAEFEQQDLLSLVA